MKILVDRSVSFFTFLCAALLLSACGYHFTSSPSEERRCTVSVPYVRGDMDGDLTAALIRQLSLSGFYVYEQSSPRYMLCVHLLDEKEEHVGFRYERDGEDQLTKTLIPTESRLGTIADVRLIDNCTGKCVIGPIPISASLAYDHDYYSSRDGVNIFSLGQLTDIDAARNAARRPLYESLAVRIVDYLINYVDMNSASCGVQDAL